MKGFDVDVTDFTCEIETRNSDRELIARQTEEFIANGGVPSQHGPKDYKRYDDAGFRIGKESIK